MKKIPKITLDHVNRLSRGQKSGIRIGSRNVGHHLQPFEREIYERALKKGFLEVDERSRKNLLHLWDKACIAKGWRCIVLVRGTHGSHTKVFCDEDVIFEGLLHEGKKIVKEQASRNV